MKRVRFAPSPTGSLHVGNALSAVANRSAGDWMLLRIDDTDAARNVPAARRRSCATSSGSASPGTRGRCARASARSSTARPRRRSASASTGSRSLREDGRPTYHLASVVDDVDFGITHVIRGNDHRPNEALHRRLTEALGATPPEYVHHGLILGEDGKKLSKRAEGATVASLREAGIPAEAVRAYLEELGVPAHDVHYDLPRIRRLAIDTIGALSDEELARARRRSRVGRAGAPGRPRPERGARLRWFDLGDAAARRRFSRRRCVRFRELVDLEPEAIVRELKAVGGDLKALRLVLTGRERGPELWAVLAALPRDEPLRRVDAAL